MEQLFVAFSVAIVVVLFSMARQVALLVRELRTTNELLRERLKR